MARLIPLLLLPACSHDFGTPEHRVLDDTGEVPTPCEISVDRTFPEGGATAHYYRDPVEFHLSAPDPTATIQAPVAGETTVLEDGRVLRFTPDPPLEPDAPYTFPLDYCGGRPELVFRTSPAGLPLADPGELVGRVWLVDLTAGRFVEGEQAGEMLADLFGRALLLGVTEANASTVRVRAAVTEPDYDRSPTQDRCFRTVTLDLNTAVLPDFNVQVQGFSFPAYDGDLTLAEIGVAGTVHPEGFALDGVAWSVSVAGAELAELIPGVDDSSEACDFAENLGVPCTPCPDASGLMCVTVSADRLRAWSVDLALEEVTESDAIPECLD